MPTRLRPLLVCRDALQALTFYASALGAKEVARFMHPKLGTLSHADLRVGELEFSVTEEARAWHSDAPPTLGGSPVILQLELEEVDAAVERACSAGAALVFPLQEFCGERMARLRDPFGHLWLLSQRLRVLSPEEIRAERDALFTRLEAKRNET